MKYRITHGEFKLGERYQKDCKIKQEEFHCKRKAKMLSTKRDLLP